MNSPKDIEKKLDELRKKWRENSEKRSIYELQARSLNDALDIYYRDHPETKLPLDKD